MIRFNLQDTDNTYHCRGRHVNNLRKLGVARLLGRRLQVNVDYGQDANDLNSRVRNAQPVDHERVFAVELARQEHDGQHDKHFVELHHFGNRVVVVVVVVAAAGERGRTESVTVAS